MELREIADEADNPKAPALRHLYAQIDRAQSRPRFQSLDAQRPVIPKDYGGLASEAPEGLVRSRGADHPR
jgi:hypothetical protein